MAEHGPPIEPQGPLGNAGQIRVSLGLPLLPPLLKLALRPQGGKLQMILQKHVRIFLGEAVGLLEVRHGQIRPPAIARNNEGA